MNLFRTKCIYTSHCGLKRFRRINDAVRRRGRRRRRRRGMVKSMGKKKGKGSKQKGKKEK